MMIGEMLGGTIEVEMTGEIGKGEGTEIETGGVVGMMTGGADLTRGGPMILIKRARESMIP